MEYHDNVVKLAHIPFIFSNFEALRCSMLPYVDQQWMENIPLYAVEAFFSKEGIGTEV